MTHAVTAFQRVLLLSQRLRNGFDRRLAPDGLSTAQAMLLTLAAEFGGQPPTFSQAAGFMSTSHQNVAKLAAGLERKGFVRVQPDPDDRRARRIHVTSASRAYFAERDADDFAWVQDRFAALSSDEQATLSELLGRVIVDLDERENPLATAG
jgi:DNA-binding MarR family transcriptional regulator